MAQSRVNDLRRQWHSFADAGALRDEVLRQLSAAAHAAIAETGAFHLVLAGGGTPAAIYAALIGLQTDWSAWFLYFGDERCVPRGDPERNDTMARKIWLDRVAVPASQVFSIPAELGAEQGAAAYARTLSGTPTFDLVLLGLGEDGHTASLFPGQPRDRDQASVLAVHDAPKPPPDRISLSARRLSDARRVWFLVTGEGKREAAQRWRRGDDIPAQAIRPVGGVDIFTDLDLGAAAASG